MLPTIRKDVKKTITIGLAWCIGISMIVSCFIAYNDDEPTWIDFLVSFGISAGYSVFYWGGTISLVEILNMKFDWLHESKKRILYGVFGTLLVSFGVTFLMHLFILVVPGKIEFVRLFSWEAFKSYLVPATINILLSLWFHLQSFFVNWKKSALNEERLKSESAFAKLEALQQQVDPHFLFNTFNVLTGLIEEDSKLAQKFVSQLSKVYRYILEVRSRSVVTVEEELEFAKSYLFLLSIRFDSGFSFTINVEDKQLSYKMVPVSLQLLIENVIKHNAVSNRVPLQIEIYSEPGFLCVKNNLNPKKALQDSSTGIGLANINSRYELLAKENMPLISKTDDEFIVKLPLIENE